MSNLRLFGIDEAGIIRRIHHRIAYDLSASEPVTSTDISAIRTGLGLAGGISASSLNRSEVDVKDFGAIGDGSHDDTASINMARDLAGTHGTLLFSKPSNFYKVTSTVGFYAGQHLSGFHSGAQVSTGQVEIRMVGGTAPVFGPADRTKDTVNVVIENLKITGAVASTAVVDFYRTNYSIIRECGIAIGVVGVLFDSAAGQCYFNSIHDCNIGYVSGVALRFQNGANANNVFGGVLQGAPRSVEFLSGSSANLLDGVAMQGQVAPDATVLHVYCDAPENKMSFCYVEGSAPGSTGVKMTRNGSIHMFGTTWGGNISVQVDDGGTVVLTGTASSGSVSTLVDNSKAWTVNQYQFYRVLITAGTGAGQIRIINTSTSNTLNVLDAWLTPPDNTSQYEISEPRVNSYIRSDLSAWQQGKLRISSNWNGITVPFEWTLDAVQGVENLIYRYKASRTSGLRQFEFWDYTGRTCFVDMANGNFISDNTTGAYWVGATKFKQDPSGDGAVTDGSNVVKNLRAANLIAATAGKGLQIKEGSNAKMGTAILVGGTVTVNTTAVTANSRIFLTNQASGGTPGFLRVGTLTAGTSFVIQSSSGADTSTIAWMIVEPAP